MPTIGKCSSKRAKKDEDEDEDEDKDQGVKTR